MTRTVQLALVLGVLLMGMSPASADDEIGLSLDGVAFTPGLPGPLFDPAIRWVPGDTRTASFFVRNQAGEGANLSVDIVGAEVDSLLETGGLTVSARGGGGVWRDVSEGGTHQLVSKVGVRPREQARVDVSVAFAATSVNQSQTKQLDLGFRVVLTQDVGAVLADRNKPAGDRGLLPDTGGPALESLVLGLILVAGGITLASRRREEVDHHVHS